MQLDTAFLPPTNQQVGTSFNHVFVPPWAVPILPPQQGVRTFREAGVQAGTGAGDDSHTASRSAHTPADAAQHYAAFQQHYCAALPHLAMALADLHLARGGDDPAFVRSRYYFNTLLHLKDELGQVGQLVAGSSDGHAGATQHQG